MHGVGWLIKGVQEGPEIGLGWFFTRLVLVVDLSLVLF